MFKSLIIGLIAFLVIASVASATGWGQPAWAPDPIELVPGQVYRTGSPLSRPGLFGLFGGILGASSGGGAELWTGSEFVPVPADQAAPSQTYPSITINGVRMRTYTHEEAQAAQGSVDWSTVENKERVTVPICIAGQRLFVTMVPDSEIGARIIYDCR